MWTRELLKSNAKRVLSKTYWKVFAVCLAAGILTGDSLSNFSVKLREEIQSGRFSFWLSSIMLLVAALVGIAALLWLIFAGNVIKVGWRRFMMENRIGASPFDTLFSAFSTDYGNVVRAMLWTDIKIFLYTLLLVVPGIIKGYEYILVPYLLAENPAMTGERAQELSKQMTEGEKLNIFVLQISFFPWYLLNLVTWGLASVFIAPYYEATFAELYAALRAKAFALGYSDAAELGDFIRY